MKQNLKETFCFLTMKLNQSIQVRKKLVDLRIRHNIHFYHGFVENLKTNNTFQCKIIYFGETRHLILHLLPRLSLTPPQGLRRGEKIEPGKGMLNTGEELWRQFT